MEKKYSRLYLNKFINKHKSKHFAFSLLFNEKRFFIQTSKIISFSLIFLLTVGVSFAKASEKALPGETLYYVKILNEEIVGLIQTSPEDKIYWEIQRTEKRIGEVTKLALNEGLDSNKQVTITKKIIGHTQKINKEIKKLELKNSEKVLGVKSKFESSLKVNLETLEKVKGKTEKVKEIKKEIYGDVTIENVEKLETKENLKKIIAVVNIEKKIMSDKQNKEIDEVIRIENGDYIQEDLNLQLSELKKSIEVLVLEVKYSEEEKGETNSDIKNDNDEITLIDETTTKEIEENKIVEKNNEEELEEIEIINNVSNVEKIIDNTLFENIEKLIIVEEKIEEEEIKIIDSFEKIEDQEIKFIEESKIIEENTEEKLIIEKENEEETPIDEEKNKPLFDKIFEEELVKIDSDFLRYLEKTTIDLFNKYNEALSKEKNGELGQAISLFIEIQQYLNEKLHTERMNIIIEEELSEIINKESEIVVKDETVDNLDIKINVKIEEKIVTEEQIIDIEKLEINNELDETKIMETETVED